MSLTSRASNFNLDLTYTDHGDFSAYEAISDYYSTLLPYQRTIEPRWKILNKSSKTKTTVTDFS